jgi:hypothetical protein
MRLLKQTKRKIVSSIAMLMAALMIFGSVPPVDVFGQNLAEGAVGEANTSAAVTRKNNRVASSTTSLVASQASQDDSYADSYEAWDARHIDGFSPLLDDGGNPVFATIVPMSEESLIGLSDNERQELQTFDRLLRGEDSDFSESNNLLSNPPTGAIEVLYGAGEYEWPHSIRMTHAGRTTTVSTKRYIANQLKKTQHRNTN